MGTNDLFIMHGLNPAQPVSAIHFSLWEDKSYFVSTVQKSIQQWFMVFMTRQGSVKSDPSMGTNFFAGLRQSNINDVQYIGSLFETAAGSVFAWFNKHTNYTDPNEIIEEAVLDKYNFDVNTGKLTLMIKFTMASGLSAIYTSPQTKLS